ncbi:MAG: hypothetical protein QF706_04455, partial [Roseibacillus sp.]|nr:hypothetical protein [Roseibacillus sp.]
FELYAHDDAKQADNLYADNGELAQGMSQDMEALRARLLEEQLVWSGEELSGAMQQALEALGYVEGGDGAPRDE